MFGLVEEALIYSGGGAAGGAPLGGPATWEVRMKHWVTNHYKKLIEEFYVLLCYLDRIFLCIPLY